MSRTITWLGSLSLLLSACRAPAPTEPGFVHPIETNSQREPDLAVGVDTPLDPADTGPTVVELDVGDSHACARLDDGGIWCWGASSRGQLGFVESRGFGRNESPVRLPKFDGVAQLALGSTHSCALLVDGQVACWGSGDSGQLDGVVRSDDVRTPTINPALGRFEQLAAGGYATCGIAAGGRLSCWGDNVDGLLGLGHDRPVAGVVHAKLGGKAKAVGLAGTLACALLDNGQVSCWGRSPTASGVTPPTVVSGLQAAVEIAVGYDFACARTETGEVLCWGANGSGQLGDGTHTTRNEARGVPGLRGVTALGVGSSHVCAASPTGLRCWGANGLGQLGDGSQADSTTPVAVTGLDAEVVELDLGTTHSCARTSGGQLRCWGSHRDSQLGIGPRFHPWPRVVPGLEQVEAIAAATIHVCARLADGTVRCVGGNMYGALGDGTNVDRSTPVAVTGVEGATRLAAGGMTCTLVDGGQARCWGAGERPSTATPVQGLGAAIDIDAGHRHTCAVLAGGKVSCWGANERAQLGAAPSSERAPTPIVGLAGVRAVALDDMLSCALLDDARVSCWGGNDFMQLGVADRTLVRADPQPLEGLADVAQVALGTRHACARLLDGDVACWGVGARGQLGDGTTVDRHTPARVPGLEGVVDIDCGGEHSCAVTSTGSVHCWGANHFGQVGDGTSEDRLAPVELGTVRGAVDVDLGSDVSCARLADGRAACWGWDYYGQLGHGFSDVRTQPVAVRFQSVTP